MSTQSMNIYHRQELIPNWDQSKLTNAHVTIIGAGKLGQNTVLPLAALGVGNIRLIGNEVTENDIFLDVNLNGYISQSIADILEYTNPSIDIIGLKSSIINRGSTYLLEGSDIIVDTTNNPESKALALEYCITNYIPFFSAGCIDDSFGRLLRYTGEEDLRVLMPDLGEYQQGDLTSLIFGGLITEEVKKILMNKGNLLTSPIYYNITNDNRFYFERTDSDISKNKKAFANKSILMVGAGALGNFVGMCLAKMGVKKIDILDYDFIEDTNLNRQVLYYDSVGRENFKADVLAKKLNTISKNRTKQDTNIRGLVKKFEEDTVLNEKYDLIFDCLDNFQTRAILNDYAIANKIPLISGATSYRGGMMAIYVPDVTDTIEDKFDLHRESARAESRRAASCILAPTPSVIMSNQILGGLMVSEARTVLCNKTPILPTNSILRYATFRQKRFLMDGGNKNE